MKHSYLAAFIILVAALPSAAQPDAAPSTAAARPDHAERNRPRTREKIGRKPIPPYLMSVGQPVLNPLFLNRSATVEPTSSEQPQNESSIAINPLRPNVLFASAVDYRNGAWAYISTNGGMNWRNVSLGDVRSGWPSGNDPSVAFDHLGHGYVMYGAIVRSGNNVGQSGIYISKSTDDGVTWTRHIPVIEHLSAMTADSAVEDKYYIEIDRSPASPYLGWMYTPWKRMIDADSSTQIMFARSTNGGLNWSAPIAISPRKSGTSLDTTFGQSFPISAVGPDGTVYVTWHDGPARSIGFARSDDGGSTFTAPRFVVTGNPTHGGVRKLGNDVYHVLKGTFRAETYPTMAADHSSSPRRGWLYLAWAAGPQPDIFFKRSSDKGVTWSETKVIHSDTTNDQWWPWLAVDPMNGDIAVMYSDSRNDPGNIYIDQYVSYSSDGGDTWIDRRTTDAMSDYRSNPFQGIFAGDYSGVAFRDGRVYPSFLDTRGTKTPNQNDVFISIVNTRQPYPVDSLHAIIDPVALTELELRWKLPQKIESIFGHPIASYSLVVERDSVPLTVLPAGTTSLAQTGLEHGRMYTYSVRVATPTDTSIARVLPVRAGGAKEPAPPVVLGVTSSRDSVDITVRTPSFRADGNVPLTNFDALIMYRDGEPRREIAFFATDTGRTVTIRDVPNDRGYYRYHFTAIDDDDPKNESASSDTVVAYAGSLEWFSESFESTPPRFLYSGDWGLTTALAASGSTSMTDSPTGVYRPRGNSFVQLFPYTAAPLTNYVMFKHIAIVDPSDTAFVEYRIGGDTTWHIAATYDWTHESVWSDSSADPGDWRMAMVSLGGPTDSMITIRFRLKTNTFRNADGWYIDDIVVTAEGGVDDESKSDLVSTVHPNPFRSVAIIDFRLPRSSHVRLRVVDIVGREVVSVDLGQREPGRHAHTVDGSKLVPGTYLYEIITDSGRSGGYLMRLP